jgi:hypothetical protein
MLANETVSSINNTIRRSNPCIGRSVATHMKEISSSKIIETVISGGGLGVQLSQLTSILCLAYHTNRHLIVTRLFKPGMKSSFDLKYQLSELSLQGSVFGKRVEIYERETLNDDFPGVKTSWTSNFPQPLFWTMGHARQRVTYFGVRFGWYYIKKYPELIRNFVLQENVTSKSFGSSHKSPKRLPQGSWGLHLRLGDYKESKTHHHLDVSYYIKAIKRAQNLGATRVTVFSDNIQQAREMLSSEEIVGIQILFFGSDPNSPWTDLRAMAACQGLILSNSTFSWWAGFLSASQNVIVPSKFFAHGSYFAHAPAWLNNLFWRKFCVPPFWTIVRV